MQNVSYMTVSSLHFITALFTVFDIVVIIAQPIDCFLLAKNIGRCAQIQIQIFDILAM